MWLFHYNDILIRDIQLAVNSLTSSLDWLSIANNYNFFCKIILRPLLWLFFISISDVIFKIVWFLFHFHWISINWIDLHCKSQFMTTIHLIALLPTHYKSNKKLLNFFPTAWLLNTTSQLSITQPFRFCILMHVKSDWFTRSLYKNLLFHQKKENFSSF